FAGALETAPALFEGPHTGHRYDAACSAALAGCGGGEGLSEDELARWRKKARAWLRADLAAWDRLMAGSAAARTTVQRALTRWQADPDLACLRDTPALEKLPASERDQCRALWDDVRALWRRARGAGAD